MTDPGDSRLARANVADLSAVRENAPTGRPSGVPEVQERQERLDRDADALRGAIERIDDEISALQKERTRLMRDLAAVWRQS